MVLDPHPMPSRTPSRRSPGSSLEGLPLLEIGLAFAGTLQGEEMGFFGSGGSKAPPTPNGDSPLSRESALAAGEYWSRGRGRGGGANGTALGTRTPLVHRGAPGAAEGARRPR